MPDRAGPAARMRSDSVAVGDGRISVLAAGEGTPIVLVASLGRGVSDLVPLATELAGRGFRAILPEPRGVGGSTPRRAVTFWDLADDIAAVARSCGAPAIVAGHAYGGGVARAVAERHPDAVRGVALLAIGARRYPDDLGRKLDLLIAGKAPEAERRAVLLETFFASPVPAQSWLTGWHPDLVAEQRRAVRTVPRAAWSGTGIAPVLDVMGGEDPFRPRESHDEIAVELGGRVATRLLPGLRHGFPDETPAETADLVADWAAGL
ncbi:alpha/beta fold hydrolase [Rhodobacterales bacterium HKCCE2091]|nr:alpha/beta fold hydrolase [Rhodobacterales bacterium HKCCE2091]